MDVVRMFRVIDEGHHGATMRLGAANARLGRLFRNRMRG